MATPSNTDTTSDPPLDEGDMIVDQAAANLRLCVINQFPNWDIAAEDVMLNMNKRLRDLSRRVSPRRYQQVIEKANREIEAILRLQRTFEYVPTGPSAAAAAPRPGSRGSGRQQTPTSFGTQQTQNAAQGSDTQPSTAEAAVSQSGDTQATEQPSALTNMPQQMQDIRHGGNEQAAGAESSASSKDKGKGKGKARLPSS